MKSKEYDLDKKRQLDNIKSMVTIKVPTAICERDGVFFFIRSGNNDLGSGFSEYAAWQSAEDFLSQNYQNVF